MDQDTISFVRSSLSQGRTVFYDFPDRYAFMLLEAAMREDEVEISSLKKGPFRSLLKKPIVRDFLGAHGRSVVRRKDLQSAWSGEVQAYRLTLGNWPRFEEKPDQRWDQITRRGWNLVLQLNFSMSHTRELEKFVPTWRDHIGTPYHPIAGKGELTLAWARIDLDLETREALIEEIQSDWIQDVAYNVEVRSNEVERWKEYQRECLKPIAKRWPDTILTAAIWFLVQEIGIRSLFYHTFESGQKLKQIGANLPPRSIYTDLPRRFCFEETHNGPLFIRDTARKELKALFTDPLTKWFVLELDH